MRLEQSFEVPVPVAQAWSVLLDLERVAPCMPGATLTGFDGTAFTGTVKVKLGPISLAYRGQGRITEKDETGHRIAFVAQGQDSRGAGGASARVSAVLHSADGGAATVVRVITDLDISGKAAQFGRGMIADVSGKVIKQFADNLAATIGASAGGRPPAPAPTPPAPPVPAPVASIPTQPAPVDGVAPPAPPAAAPIFPVPEAPTYAAPEAPTYAAPEAPTSAASEAATYAAPEAPTFAASVEPPAPVAPVFPPPPAGWEPPAPELAQAPAPSAAPRPEPQAETQPEAAPDYVPPTPAYSAPPEYHPLALQDPDPLSVPPAEPASTPPSLTPPSPTPAPAPVEGTGLRQPPVEAEPLDLLAVSGAKGVLRRAAPVLIIVALALVGLVVWLVAFRG